MNDLVKCTDYHTNLQAANIQLSSKHYYLTHMSYTTRLLST